MVRDEWTDDRWKSVPRRLSGDPRLEGLPLSCAADPLFPLAVTPDDEPCEAMFQDALPLVVAVKTTMGALQS
jgi:hypothetical protein